MNIVSKTLQEITDISRINNKPNISIKRREKCFSELLCIRLSRGLQILLNTLLKKPKIKIKPMTNIQKFQHLSKIWSSFTLHPYLKRFPYFAGALIVINKVITIVLQLIINSISARLFKIQKVLER